MSAKGLEVNSSPLGKPVAVVAPASGQVLRYNASTGLYTPADLTGFAESDTVGLVADLEHNKSLTPTLLVPETAGVATLPAQGAFGQVSIADTGSSGGLVFGSPEALDTHYGKGTASYEAFPRWAIQGKISVLSTGRLFGTAIALPKNFTVTSITFVGGAAAVTPTHWWFTLMDNTFKTLRSSADQLTAAWAADTAKTLALSSPFKTTYEGLHYIGIMQAAATVVTLAAVTNGNSTPPAVLTPLFGMASNTGLTTAPADGTTMTTSLTGTFNTAWGYVL